MGLREALTRFAAGLDPAGLTPAQAAGLLAEVAVIERTAAGLTMRLSARAALAGSWRAEGAGSPAAMLARSVGVSLVEANARLRAGQRLAGQPGLAQAAAAGRLSAPQLVAVSEAAGADPDAAAGLVELAEQASLAELAQECARRKAAVALDAAARRARIHTRRALRHYTDAEGVGHLHWLDNPERIAEVLAGIAPARERLFVAARRAGRREPAPALDADALVETVRAGVAGSPAPGGPGGGTRPAGRAKILVRIDFDALLRGHPINGEVSEIVGVGPVAVEAVRDLIDSGQPLLVALACHGERVAGVASVRRRPSAAQLAALEWLAPSCAVLGCAASARLQVDHRVPWATSKITLLELLDRLCARHHRLKTVHGWGLVDGHGKRAFVAPSDPRHPGRAPSSTPLHPPPVAPG